MNGTVRVFVKREGEVVHDETYPNDKDLIESVSYPGIVVHGERVEVGFEFDPPLGHDGSKKSAVREEFIVCYAAGYPDPYRPWPNTLEEAMTFAREHRINGVTGEPVDPAPLVKRRLVSDWEVVSPE